MRLTKPAVLLALLSCLAAAIASRAVEAAPGPPPPADGTAAALLEQGDRLEIEGRWYEALVAYRSAIEAAERDGPDDPLMARILIAASRLNARMNPISHTRAGWLDRAKRILGEAMPPCAEALRLMGTAQWADQVRECLAWTASRPPGSVETARALGEIGIHYSLSARRFDDLRPFAARDLENSRRLFGGEHPAVGWAEAFLGLVRANEGICDESRSHLQRALDIFERTLAPDRPPANIVRFMMATSCNPPPHETAELAARYVLAGQSRCDAEDELIDGPMPDYAAFLKTRLFRRFSGGDPEGAEETVRLYREAVEGEADRLGADDGCRALALFLDATWASGVGDIATAIRLYREMAQRLVAAYGPQVPLLGWILNTWAGNLNQIGETDRAVDVARRGVATTDRSGIDPFLRGLNLNMLADTLGPENEAQRQELLGRAIEIWSSFYGDNSPHAATLRGNLGVFAEQRGDLEAARRHFEDFNLVGSIDTTSQPSDHLGSLYFRLGRLEEAERLLEDAAAKYARSLGPGNASRLRVEATLAAVRAARGDRAGAMKRSLDTAAMMREQLRIASRGAPERLALKLALLNRWGLDLALSLAGPDLDPPSRERLFDEVIRSRAVVLDEISGRRRLSALARDPATAALAAAFGKYATRLANLSLSGSADDEIVALWRERKERAEVALALKSASFARSLESEKVGLEHVRAALGPSTALVAYTRHDADAAKPRPYGVPPDPEGPAAAYLAFVLRPGNPTPSIVHLGPAASVDALVRQWRTGISSRSREPEVLASGARLRSRIWDPVSEAIGNVTRVLVVPDGLISFVSFAALPDAGGAYLAESGPSIHLVSAERDLAVARQAADRHEGLLVVGDPDFDDTSSFAALREGAAPAAPVKMAAAEIPLGLEEEVSRGGSVLRGRRSSCENLTSLEFHRLPGSAGETRSVATLWGLGARTLSGPAASEAKFKSEVTHHRLVHVASHAFFLDGGCGGEEPGTRGIGSVAPVSSDTPAPAPAKDVPLRESPLLLSGIALAGANHRQAAGPDEEDGILTAEEIATLDLSGLAWAVLSACDTGVGDIRSSEGVFGLRRAFQIAGAGTLIMSLWPVDDESTRKWMAALYGARLKRGLDTAEAVRAATLATLRSRRAAGQSTNPFYWAAFVAVGDWR